MEEKVLIKSEQYNVKKFFNVMVIIGIALFVLSSIKCIYSSIDQRKQYYDADHKHDYWCYSDDYRDDFEADKSSNTLYEDKMDCANAKYGRRFSYATSVYFSKQLWKCLIPAAAFALIGGFIYLLLRSYELTVTDKRIYSKVVLGKCVTLPIDSISAAATIRILKGVSVSTSSGRISFLFIKNADEIYTVMNNLLIERQQ